MLSSDFEKFQHFAESRVGASAFRTDADSDTSHVFHSSLESSIQRFEWTKGATNKAGEKFDIAAGFVDIFSPNAFAERFDNTHYIGMHTALFVSINEFALFCFAQSDFFPDLGNPSEEVSPKPWDDRVPGLWLIDYTAKGGHVNNDHSSALIPRDPTRYHFSQYLSFLMCRFVWLHELAHCFNGHVDYVQNRNICLRLNEIPDASLVGPKCGETSETANATTLQCLEFDADQSALWGGVQIQLGRLENIEGIAKLPQSVRLKLALFGSYAMTWLFEQYQIYMRSEDEHSHPEPLQRLQFLFRTVRENLLSQHPELADLNSDALGQFDHIRSRIPNLYATDKLREMFNAAADHNPPSDIEQRRLQVLEELKNFQYSDRSSRGDTG